MGISRVVGIWFSPTGSTGKVVQAVAKGAADVLTGEDGASHGVCGVADNADGALRMNGEERFWSVDLTPPAARQHDFQFGEGDLVIIGCPTYAGRLPNRIMPDLREHLHGNGAACIAVVTYGNRSCDESLKELALIMKENGFDVAGAVAAVCRHAFTEHLAPGRPDEADLATMADFGGQAALKLRTEGIPQDEQRMPGAYADGSELFGFLAEPDPEIGPYYIPRKEDGSPARFLKAKSGADPGKCCRCMLCAAVCPMGSIDREDPFSVPGICIKCQACVRRCPVRARYFDDPDFLSHVRMLEETYTDRKENVFILAADQ